MAIAQRQSTIPALATVRSQSTEWSKVKRVLLAILRGVLYVVLTLIFLIPFIWMMFGSLRQESEITGYLYPFGWHTFYPINWTFNHYLDVLGLSEAGKQNGLNFGRNLLNSFIVSTGVVISSL